MRPVRRANGALSAVLPESYMEAMLTTRGADGTLRHACVHDVQSARQLLLFPVPATVNRAPGALEEK